MRRVLRAAASPTYLAVLLVVVVGFVLRVDNNGYGLPYVYNVDEGSHFTARAVGMLGGGWDPHYFQNPSAFTYLANFALRLRFGHLNPFGSFAKPIAEFKSDPTAIYVTTRTVAAVLGVVGIVAVFWAGRRLWSAGTGVAAAAVMAFGFLPVTYSRIAVTDVGTLVFVPIAIVAAVLVWEDARLRWWIIAGAASGFAVGFKYTAGLALLPLAVAGLALLVRDRRGALRVVALGAVAAALACVAAFFITTPYFFFDFSDAHRQLSAQATTAGDFGKVGQTKTGLPYYLWTLTWGFGWVPLAAMLAGAALEFRRSIVRGLIFASFPLALLVYLSLQARWFSRWFLPAYPVFALLAGAAIAQAASALAGLRSRTPALAAPLLLAVLTVVAIVQPLAADARTGALLGRTDTRQIARDWLVENYPGSLRVVIEPAVPARYYRRAGRGAQRNLKVFVRGFAKHQAETRVQYPSLLKPQYLAAYRKTGFCLVMVMSVIEGRAVNAHLAPALAYYDELRRQSDDVFHVSPYKPGTKQPKFDFDLSYNYYPSNFHRPGPEVTIYKLKNCKQGFGKLEGPLPGGIS